jgi:short-subunit dehydrogenase
MKYAITGHTQGIGKSIFERLSPNIVGFSKSLGYDIKNFKDRQQLIKESQDVDVFINNACDGFGQVDLLIDLFHFWKDTNKTIINVGSRIAEEKIQPEYIHLLPYYACKTSLKSLCNDLQGYSCNVKYCYFGYVGTERILKKYPNLKDYISINDAVNIILNS